MLANNAYTDPSAPEIYQKNSIVQFESAKNFLLRYAGWLRTDAPENNVFDAGCGTGELTAWIAGTFGVPATGMDISVDRIRSASENYRSDTVHFFHGNLVDIEKNNYSEKYQTVVSFNMLHHLPQSAQLAAFRSIRFLLNHSGVALLLIPAKNRELHDAFQETIARPCWQDIFRGFRIENVRTYEDGDYYSSLLKKSGFDFADAITLEESPAPLDFAGMKNFLKGWLPHLAWLKIRGADEAAQEKLLDEIVSCYYEKMGIEKCNSVIPFVRQNRIVAAVSQQGLFGDGCFFSPDRTMTRLALKRDLENIAACHAAAFAKAYRHRLADSFINKITCAFLYRRWEKRFDEENLLTLIAEHHGKLQGFITADLSANHSPEKKHSKEITYLYVDPSCQRQGVGKQLVRALAKHLLRNGIRAMHVEALDGFQQSNSFYHTLGGRISGRHGAWMPAQGEKDAVWTERIEFCFDDIRKIPNPDRGNFHHSPDTGQTAHILIPVHNTEKYILDTIRSALAQTWNKLKILVFDDGCTDSSIKLLNDFLASHDVAPNRVLIRSSAVRLGVAAARKALFTWSCEQDPAAYRFWLDSDDRMSENNLIAQVMQQMEHTRADICLYHFSVAFEDENQRKNAAVLLNDSKGDEILSQIHFSKNGYIDPGRFHAIAEVTSLGTTKCYAPFVRLPEAENCPYEDFVYMAALFSAGRVTALPSDYRPVEYLRRASSMCGQRTHETFAAHIPQQLIKLWRIMVQNASSDSNGLARIMLAKKFIENKISNYHAMLENFVIKKQWPDIDRHTLEKFTESTNCLLETIRKDISALEENVKYIAGEHQARTDLSRVRIA